MCNMFTFRLTKVNILQIIIFPDTMRPKYATFQESTTFDIFMLN